MHIVLQREGWAVNPQRIHCLYKELGLQLRNNVPGRRVKAKLRKDRQPATQANEAWAMDFVHDQLATGRRIRVLTVVGICSQFSPPLDPRFSYRGEDLVVTLERICGGIGTPGASASTRAPRLSGVARSLGRSEGRLARLRQVPGRVPEHALVHAP